MIEYFRAKMSTQWEEKEFTNRLVDELKNKPSLAAVILDFLTRIERLEKNYVDALCPTCKEIMSLCQCSKDSPSLTL